MVDFTNSDGLTRHYGPQTTSPTKYQVVNIGGGVKQLVIDMAYNDLPDYDADASGGTTPDSFSDAIPYIPAGSIIKSAVCITVTDWATSTSATLDIGTYNKAGTAIDADGIFDGLAAASLDAGDVAFGNGVDVADGLGGGTFDGAVISTTANAYVKAIVTTGSFTTGKSRLVIEYIEGVAA